MNVGFTGTQVGMTKEQKSKFIECLRYATDANNDDEFHHGDCIGSDEQASKIAHDFGLKVVLHPPVNRKKRAFCKYDKIKIAKPYLVRNRDIVNDTDILFATPKEEYEVLRSGTWSTIRYALKVGKRVLVFYPSGVMEEMSKYK